MMKKFLVLAFVIVFSPMRTGAEPDANNNCSSATAITFNEASYPTLNPSDDPEDYFSMTVPLNYVVNLTLGTDVPNPCVVSWKLYDEGGDCNMIKSSGQIDKYMGKTWEKIIEESGNYKLQLIHGGGATGDSQFYMVVEARQKISIEYEVTIQNPEDKQVIIRMDIANISSDIIEFWEEIPWINITELTAKDKDGNLLIVDTIIPCDGCPNIRRIHCNNINEVFITYTIQSKVINTDYQSGYYGYIGSDFAVFDARTLFLFPIDYSFIDSITVSFQLPEDWKIFSHWPLKDGVYHPLDLKAIDIGTVFQWSILGLGHFGHYTQKIGKTEVIIAAYEGWPALFKENLAKSVWGIYSYQASVWSSSLEEPYLAIFSPSPSDDIEIIGAYSEYGQTVSNVKLNEKISFQDFANEIVETRWIGFDWGFFGRAGINPWCFNGFANYYARKSVLKAHIIDSANVVSDLLGAYDYPIFLGYDKPLTELDGNDKYLSYIKGGLVSFLIAKEIYTRTNGRINFDDFNRILFEKYWFKEVVIGTEEVKSELEELTKTDFTEFFNHYVYGTTALPKTWASQDLDGDGLLNAGEILWDTNPGKTDSDSDGYTDKDEIDAGTDPADRRSCPGPCPVTPCTWVAPLLLSE
jgi:hypothetical protein